MQVIKQYCASDTFRLPRDAQFLSVGLDHQEIVVNVLFDDSDPCSIPYRVHLVKTGSPLDAPPLSSFVGTVAINERLTWHVFVHEAL